jgi:hypothetical protein
MVWQFSIVFVHLPLQFLSTTRSVFVNGQFASAFIKIVRSS